MIIKNKKLLSVLIGFALINGCKDSSSDDDDASTSTSSSGAAEITDLSNFKLATSLSLVDTSSDTTSLAVDTTGFAEDSDYRKDVTQAYVHDIAFEPLDTVNSILCFIGQMAFGEKAKADFVAGGEVYPFTSEYIAQIDDSECESKGQQDQGSQSAGSSKSILNVNVGVARESATAPLQVVGWFDEEEEEDRSQRIVFRVSVLEPAAGEQAKNSLGQFEMNFVGLKLKDGQAGEPVMRGLIRVKESDAGKVEVRFVNEGGGEKETFFQAAAADLTSDEEGEIIAGVGRTVTEFKASFDGQDFEEKGAFNLAFNDSHFLREVEGKGQACLAMDKPNMSAWRYGVYDSTGKRVAMNGGFPIRFEKNGKKGHGFAGYWGLFTPPHISLASGDTVTKETPTGEGEKYTVLAAPGKLIKNTKKPLTLEEFKKVPLEAWNQTGRFKVKFDGTKFAIVGKWKESENGGTFEPSSGTFALENASGQNNFHSEALGGPVFAIFESSVFKNAFYYEQEIASNTLASTTLYCLRECLKPNLDSTMIQNGRHVSDGSGIFYQETNSDGTDIISKSAPIAYTWDAATLSLKKGSDLVGIKSGVSSVSGENSWGFQSGPLVTSVASITNPWDVYAQDTFYVWETGPNSWNKFTALKKSDNSLVKFDRPRFYTYVHKKEYDAVGADSSEFYDRPYLLKYEGFGNLHGIPDENHGEGEKQHWAPAFTIKSGTTIKDGADNKEYVIKILEAEERLRSVDESHCSELKGELGAVPELVTIDLWADPTEDGIPEPTGAPSVIEGELQ